MYRLFACLGLGLGLMMTTNVAAAQTANCANLRPGEYRVGCPIPGQRAGPMTNAEVAAVLQRSEDMWRADLAGWRFAPDLMTPQRPRWQWRQ